MTEDKKLIIWDLFGGGQNSVYKTLEEFDYLDSFEVYTFDITESYHRHQYKIDLSQENIIKVFKNFPKPDIIVASPLCQSFSQILQMKGGGTCFWKFNQNKDKLIERTIEEFETLKSGFTRYFDAKKQLLIKRLGEKCINNTIELIQYFKPKVWYIENPKSSLIWDYITKNRNDFFDKEKMFFNLASYGKYGYLNRKDTYFLSNVKMTLKSGKSKKIYREEGDFFILEEDLYNDLISYIPNLKKKMNKRKSRSGLSGMDFIDKRSKKLQANESGVESFIPHKLIQEIFFYFYGFIIGNENDYL